MSSISIESFIAGFAYGGTTVLVGQPLETLKTLTQVHSSTSALAQKPSLIQTATNLCKEGGIRAFYRGGMPLLLGGGLMRSAQFGFYNRYVFSCVQQSDLMESVQSNYSITMHTCNFVNKKCIASTGITVWTNAKIAILFRLHQSASSHCWLGRRNW